MNILHKTLFALVTGVLMSASAQAMMDYDTSQPYLGIKVGKYDIDATDADDAMSYSVYAGYYLTDAVSMEAEYLMVEDTNLSNKTSSGEYSANLKALYGAYSFNFPNTGIYTKMRLGLAQHEIDIDAQNATGAFYSRTYSDTGLAGGIGMGYHVSPLMTIEAMYNKYPSVDRTDMSDINAEGISIGAHFRF